MDDASALRLDGNAAGGILSEIFAPDLTTALASCAHCGATRPVGALLVYAHGMGMVVRCPSCDAVVIGIGRTPARLWLDLSGARHIVIAAASSERDTNVQSLSSVTAPNVTRSDHTRYHQEDE